MINATNEFRNMMNDLLFGENGYFKDLPEKNKAAALDIINNTTIVSRQSCEDDSISDKKYQVFELSQDGKYLLSCTGHKDYLIFYGTQGQGFDIWNKLTFEINLLKEVGVLRNINLVNGVHYFDTQEDMQDYLNSEYGEEE